MRKQLILILAPLLLFISCTERKNNDVAELTAVVNQLRNDKDHKFLMTLKPTEEDCRLIFKKGASADKVVKYVEMKWANTEGIPDNAMKPVTDDATIKILSASISDLKSGETNGIPIAYLNLANHLNDGIHIYALLYLNKDGSEQKQRAAFFKASDKWVIIPQAFSAF